MSRFVSEYFTHAEVLQSLLDSTNQKQNLTPLLAKIEKGKIQIDQLKAERKRLLHLTVKGLFSADEIETEAQRVDSEMRSWTAIVRRAETELTTRRLSDTKALAQRVSGVFAEFEFLDRSERKSLLKKLVSRIEVSSGHITKVRLRLPEAGAKLRTHTGRGSWLPPA